MLHQKRWPYSERRCQIYTLTTFSKEGATSVLSRSRIYGGRQDYRKTAEKDEAVRAL